jgi:hypothetical protein
VPRFVAERQPFGVRGEHRPGQVGDPDRQVAGSEPRHDRDPAGPVDLEELGPPAAARRVVPGPPDHPQPGQCVQPLHQRRPRQAEPLLELPPCQGTGVTQHGDNMSRRRGSAGRDCPVDVGHGTPLSWYQVTSV